MAKSRAKVADSCIELLISSPLEWSKLRERKSSLLTINVLFLRVNADNLAGSNAWAVCVLFRAEPVENMALEELIV